MGTQEIQVGKTYRVKSERKGTFIGKVANLNDVWADIDIISGHASAMLQQNERYAGEQVTIRRSLCTFEEVPA